MTSSALAATRVLDLSCSAAGAWCSRMLADLGADVVMVEGPGGHPLRALPPFDEAGRSVTAEYFLASRRSLALDLEAEDDLALARRLAGRVDIAISSARPADLARRRMRLGDLENPALVMVHVTPWGMTGDLAQAPGNDLAVAARSGWASINGSADREPLKPSGLQASYCTGVAAATAAVAALYHRDATGEGQEVDIAAVDVMAAAFAPAVLRGQYSGEPMARKAEADLLAGPVPVADGHFALTISRAHFWRDAMNLLGLTDLAEDTRYESGWYRQAHKDDYVGRVQERMLSWRRWELFEELAIRRVIAGPVATMAELAELEHLRERGFWVEAAGGDGRFPGAPFKMSATPLAAGRPASGPGEQAQEILREIQG